MGDQKLDSVSSVEAVFGANPPDFPMQIFICILRSVEEAALQQFRICHPLVQGLEVLGKCVMIQGCLNHFFMRARLYTTRYGILVKTPAPRMFGA